MTTSIRQVVGYAATQSPPTVSVRQTVSYAAQQIPASIVVRDSIAYAFYQPPAQLAVRDVFAYGYTAPLLNPQSQVRDINPYAYVQQQPTGGVRNLTVYLWEVVGAPLPNIGSLPALLVLINQVTSVQFAVTDLNFGAATADSSVAGTDTSVVLSPTSTDYSGTMTVHYNRGAVNRLINAGVSVSLPLVAGTHVNDILSYLNAALNLNLVAGDLNNDALTGLSQTSLTLTSANTSYMLEPATTVTINVTPATAMLLNAEGANGATTTTDSVTGATFTAAGTATLSTAAPLVGASSFNFPGSPAHFSAPNQPSYAVGTGDFTWDCEFNVVNINGSSNGSLWPLFFWGFAFSGLSSTPINIGIYYGESNSGINNGNGYFVFGVNNANNAAVFILPNNGRIAHGVKHHIAFVRHNGVLTCYLDGVQLSVPVAYTFNISNVTVQPVYIGRMFGNTDASTSWYAFGEIDDVRISKVARWLAPFTPPTVQLARD